MKRTSQGTKGTVTPLRARTHDCNATAVKSTVDDLVNIISGIRKKMISGMITNADTPKLAGMRRLDASHMLADDDFIFGLTECTPDVIWPVDVGLAMKSDDGNWHFTRARSVHAKDLRGKIRFAVPRLLAIECVDMNPNGSFLAAVEHLAWMGKKWVDADYKTTVRNHDSVRLMPEERIDHFNGKGSMFMAAAIRHRYEWSVSIGEPNGPSFRFATDAIGIKAMLAERDKGESGRREGLRSWVTDHWRKSRPDSETEVYVRKHLRGGEKFNWMGYECEWLPSQYDVEKNAALKDERALMGQQAKRPLQRGAP
jgi:hypothetical protein